jgi:hypothetical protein
VPRSHLDSPPGLKNPDYDRQSYRHGQFRTPIGLSPAVAIAARILGKRIAYLAIGALPDMPGVCAGYCGSRFG